MTKGHISSVEFLAKKTDEECIAESRELFERLGVVRGTDGFEVWDGGRIIYRFPENSPVRS
jgi:hypothetical protein